MNTQYETVELNNPHFAQAVLDILKNNKDIEEIIETGTHNGTGSTKIFAKTGLPVKTIEVQRAHHDNAKENLKDFDNVEFFLGLSLPYDEMVKFIKDDQYYYKYAVEQGIDCEPDPVNFYIQEINGWESPETRVKTENLLPNLINNDKKQLILLDSAGGVGYLEYREVMKLSKEQLSKKVLMLDDINHVKHARTIERLEYERYIINKAEDGRSAYCTFEKTS